MVISCSSCAWTFVEIFAVPAGMVRTRVQQHRAVQRAVSSLTARCANVSTSAPLPQSVRDRSGNLVRGLRLARRHIAGPTSHAFDEFTTRRAILCRITSSSGSTRTAQPAIVSFFRVHAAVSPSTNRPPPTAPARTTPLGREDTHGPISSFNPPDRASACRSSARSVAGFACSARASSRSRDSRCNRSRDSVDPSRRHHAGA